MQDSYPSRYLINNMFILSNKFTVQESALKIYNTNLCVTNIIIIIQYQSIILMSIYLY